MSESNSPKADTGSPSLLGNLRQFRFQKKQVKPMNMSDDDSNLVSPEIQSRRKPVNRIEDSDSDVSSPAKTVVASSNADKHLDGNEDKHNQKYLKTLYPQNDTAEVLSKSNWNADETEEEHRNNRKRITKDPHRASRKKRRKLNANEDVDVDSDEANYKDKVFDSDDDSDVEISNDLTGDKKAVLEFMQNAVASELLLMSQCSQKKSKCDYRSKAF